MWLVWLQMGRQNGVTHHMWRQVLRWWRCLAPKSIKGSLALTRHPLLGTVNSTYSAIHHAPHIGATKVDRTGMATHRTDRIV